jgi:hypothetical protein
MEFYSLEPFGNPIENYRMGIISSVIANVHRGKNSRTYSPEDFIPKIKRRQTWEEQYNIVKTLNRLFHGEEK